MFRKLIIKNIECHKQTEIDFTEYSNCIVGKTGSGKSALLRALSSLLFTTMNIRFHETTGSVRLVTDSVDIMRERVDDVKVVCSACGKVSDKSEISKCCGKPIAVRRKKVSDIYTVNGKVYNVMGNGFSQLPDDIVKALPIAIMEVGKTTLPISIRKQFDSFIWDTLSARDLSRIFSIIEGYGYVDKLNENLKKKIRDINKNIKEYESMVPELEEASNLKKDAYLAADSEYKRLERICEEYTEALEKYNLLSQAVDDIISKSQELKTSTDRLKNLNVVDVGNIEDVVKEYEQLNGAIENIESSDSDLRKLKKQLSSLPDVINCENVESTLNDYVELSTIINSIKDLMGTVKCESDNINNINTELENIAKEIMEMNVCPFSGYEWNNQCKERYLEEQNENSI